MAYDEALGNRVREKFAALGNTEEKEMMGGLVFMYNDKMCAGIIKDELIPKPKISSVHGRLSIGSSLI